MICKYCLTKIDDDSVFCESCGNRVSDIGSNEETQLIPKVEEKVIPSRSAAFAAKAGKAPAASEDEAVENTGCEDFPPGTKVKEVWVSPDVLLPVPEEPEPAGQIFCMACGNQLPKGAAFCAMCGTPTGEVSPVDLTNVKVKPKVAIPILKEYFVRPAKAIDKAASADAFSLGAGVLLIKDLLIALIAALCIEQLAPVMKESWLLAGDAFGFGAKLFMLAVCADVILIALIFGAGILFKAAGTVKETVAVCGTAALLPAILWLITLLMQAFAPAEGLCAAMISLAVSVIFIGKAIGTAAKLKDSETMYMITVVMIIYIAVIYGGLTWIIA